MGLAQVSVAEGLVTKLANCQLHNRPTEKDTLRPHLRVFGFWGESWEVQTPGEHATPHRKTPGLGSNPQPHYSEAAAQTTAPITCCSSSSWNCWSPSLCILWHWQRIRWTGEHGHGEVRRSRWRRVRWEHRWGCGINAADTGWTTARYSFISKTAIGIVCIRCWLGLTCSHVRRWTLAA